MQKTNRRLATIAAFIALAMINSFTFGQCETWLPFGNGLPAGVRALATYNGKLIAAGHMLDGGGGKEIGWIRTWNGPSGEWQALGNAPLYFFNDSQINSLAIYNGDLIVAGWLDPAGGDVHNGIARWSGSAWEPLGEGIDGIVYALAVYHGQLIAAGYFQTAGGQAAMNIARWNGSIWQPLGAGIGQQSDYQRVYALGLYNGELVAGGMFTTAGGQNANNIARWNGTQWKSLGAGIAASGPPYFYATVFGMKAYQGELVAVGQFSSAGGHSVNSIARWNGSAWHSMGSTTSDADRFVRAIGIYNGDLMIGVASTNGDVARWTGSTWQFFGSNLKCESGCLDNEDVAGIFSVAVFNGDLIAAGRFSVIDDNPAYNIARWHDCNVCPSDITRDGKVDLADLRMVLDNWGDCQPAAAMHARGYDQLLQPAAAEARCAADIYPAGGDGKVDHNDLVAILNAWGACR